MLFLGVGLRFGRVRAKRKEELARFKADEAEARGRLELERQPEQQEQQRNDLAGNRAPIAHTPPVPDLQLLQSAIPPKPKETQVSLASLGLQASANNESSLASPKSSRDTSCPNCVHAVRPGAVFCPNCRYQLLPAVPSPRSQLRTLPVLEFPGDKAMTSSIASQPQQEKETELDDLAVRAALQRFWDRAAR